MNPTKNLIELKLYMNPTKNLIEDKQNNRQPRTYNTETLAILGTPDTGRRQTKQGTTKNVQYRDAGNIGHNRHRTKIKHNIEN